jgi:hypothetical protein
MTNNPRVQQQAIIETSQIQEKLPTEFVGTFKAEDATPSVMDCSTWKCAGDVVTITNFDDGQEGQHLSILGDGATTLEHGTNIVLSAGSDTLLASATVYEFVLLDDVWYQVGGSGSSSGSSGMTRGNVDVTTASIADNASATGTVTLGKSFELFKVTVDRDCRVRLYQTSADRTADAARAIGTDPDSAAGVICDLVFDGFTEIVTSPRISGNNQDSPVTDTIYYSITNLSGATSTVAVTFNRAVTEF